MKILDCSVKKVLSLFLSIVMLFSITAGLDLSAYAAKSGVFEYQILEDGTVKITDYTGSATDLTIPFVIEGYIVTSIGISAFEDCDSLTSVTIPDSVTSIGTSTFWNCDNLTSLTIPDSVTSIGSYAFSNCSSLTSVTIPKSVTSIGSFAFEDCDSLTSIDVDSQNQYYASQDGVLFNKDKTKLIQYPIGNTRTAYTIPNSVASIGSYAFSNCTSLTSITIPNSVTSINVYAFSGCISLTSITIPNSVTSIGKKAFSYCNSLTSIDVDSQNQYYASQDGVLFNKDKIELIQYPAGNTRKAYTIPSSVTNIGESAFYDCTSLTSVTIPDSVTSIGRSAFSHCTSLTSVTIPNSVTSIGDYAFSFSNHLKQIDYFGCENEWKKINKGTSTDSTTTINCQYNKYIKETYTDATSTAHGAHIVSSYCEYCNVPISEKSTVIHYDVSTDVAATCTQPGLVGETKCLVCDEVLTKGEVIQKLGHSFTKYASNNDATCTKDGTKTAKCDRCNETNTITEVGTALGHSFTKYVNNDATCTKDGTKTAKCDRCNETNTITEVGTALGHSFTKYVSNNDATCTKDGTKTAKCDRCNVVDTIADKGSAEHKYLVSKTVNATCTAQGSVTYICKACSDSYTKILPALGHKYKRTVVKPTYTNKGYTKYTCSVCKDSYKAEYVDRLTLEFDKTYRGTTEISADESINSNYTRTYKMVLPKSGYIFLNGKSNAECHISILEYETSYSMFLGYFGFEYNADLDEYIYRDKGPIILPAGTYGILIESIDGIEPAQAEYNLKISYTSSNESFTESYLPETKYDNMKQAKKINLDKTYKGAVAFGGDTVDFYKITVAKKTSIILNFDAKSCDQDYGLTFEILDSNAYEYSGFSELKIINSNATSATRRFTLNKGTYYIKISAHSSTESAFYSFSLKKEADNIPKTIKLSKTSYTYNGKVHTPSVTVKDSKGKTLKKNTDYTVTYAKGRKNTGKYAVKITFKGKYSGSKTLYFTIKSSLKSASLSKTAYTYNGKAIKPSATVKGKDGRKLKNGSDYTRSYSKGCKNVGQYTVTIKGKGYYTGTIKKTFKINPKRTALSSVSAKKKAFNVKWKKQTSQTTGYQIQYSTSSKFKSAKTVTVSKNKTISKSISKLKAKKKYYVRIRTYKTVGKTKYYSSWSKAKAVTTKR